MKIHKELTFEYTANTDRIGFMVLSTLEYPTFPVADVPGVTVVHSELVPELGISVNWLESEQFKPVRWNMAIPEYVLRVGLHYGKLVFTYEQVERILK